MKRKRAFIAIASGALLSAVLIAAGCRSAQPLPGTLKASMAWDGLERTYYLHVPPSLKAPAALVFAFHGGLGTAPGFERFSGFTPVSDREGFIVVYPQGIDNRWNDYREVEKPSVDGKKVDDVGFIGALVDKLVREYPVDPKRIYSTGASNGGFLSQALGARCSEKFAAIAPVIGGMSTAVAESFAPAQPVSVLVIQGSDDPFVPIHGGSVIRNRGTFIDTDEAVRKWVAHDGCRPEPASTDVIDSVSGDKTKVTRTLYGGGKAGTEVALWVIEGGGHTWPQGSQYLPVFLIGRVSLEFNGTEEIWKFFKAHPKP